MQPQPQKSAKPGTRSLIALCVTSILWGTTWVASKIAVKEMPGLQVAGIRQLIAGSLLVSFFLFKGEKIPTAKQFAWLTMMALLMFTGSNGLATVSLKYIPSGLSALIGALYPLCVVIIERVLYKNNRIGALTFAGLFLGIGGIAIVFYDSAFHGLTPGFGTGVITSLGSMLTWSIATIIIARNSISINPYNATGWQMLIGSFFLFLITGITGNHIAFNKIPASAWLSIGYLVLAGSIIAFAAFIYTMRHMEPAIAALYAYINPLVAIITGTLIAGEHLTSMILIGSVITLIGVYLVNQSMRKQKEKYKLKAA